MIDAGFPHRLRLIRSDRNLTQAGVGRMMAQAAQGLGVPLHPVSKVTIGRYERGKSMPDPLYALLLCRSLQVDAKDLALDRVLTPERLTETLDSIRSRPPALLEAAGGRDVACVDETPSAPAASPPPPTALHQLPPDLPDLIGRDSELERILRLLESVEHPNASAAPICVITGKPGAGKSALAIRAGHTLRPRFPDIQLYVDLCGPNGEPLEPSAVLAGLLRDLGVASGVIPAEIGGRAALYRSLLSDKHALIVLDGAAEEGQVRPLLPGSPWCAVLVTSRSRLTALSGAELCELTDIPLQQAVELLGRLAGRERTEREREAADRIVRLCGGLPLALRIAGATLKAKRHWTMRRLAERLEDERSRLDLLRLGDLDVRASFDLSYRILDPDVARVFRFLSLLPGLDFSTEPVAALLGRRPAETEAALERLHEAQLIEASDDGRYRVHDLFRVFSRERLGIEEPDSERELALDRMLGWYLNAARRTAALIPEQAQAGQEAPALSWFEIERVSLVRAVAQANDAERWDVAVGLADALMGFFAVRAHWFDEQRVLEVALESTRRRGSLHEEGCMLSRLARVYAKQGRWSEATSRYDASRRIFHRARDGRCESRAAVCACGSPRR
jgi:transcriptional regulator with XRE-family HTH domain